MDELRGKERRQAERRRLMGPATIFWKAAGHEISCVGNAFDISDAGILIEAPQYMLVGAATSVQINRSGQRMDAIVRYCRKHGAWYRIGLQFRPKSAPAGSVG